MTRIALIGAGSAVFTGNLCNDIFLTPALRESTIALMDIDAARLGQARDLVQAIAEHHGLNVCLETTLDRLEAVRGADYVITTFQQGGLEAYRLDIEIPQRYGVEQCVGDTLGPGGIFRALRSVPVLVDLCREMDDVAPDALLINYVNPMAANCWGVYAGTGRPCVGLCHSVQGTTKMLARWVDVPYDDVVFLSAGINHMAWILEFRQGDEDLYPRLWQAIERPEILAQSPVRIDLMKHFGYFITESSAHASEYVPYYRKSAQMVNEDLAPQFEEQDAHWCDFGRTGGYLRECRRRFADSQREHQELLEGVRNLPTQRTHEYGPYIIEAMESNRPERINGNVPNWGLIDNVPQGCCVEVPCLVDGNGVQPTAIGALPTQLAALIRTNVNVQELIVEAALTGDTERVHHAAMLDPLTAAVCTLPQIRSMVNELLAAQAQWLPQFQSTLS